MESDDVNIYHETSPCLVDPLYGKIREGITNKEGDDQVINLEKMKINAQRSSRAYRTYKLYLDLNPEIIERSEPDGYPFIKKNNRLKKVFDVYILILVQYSVISSLYFLGFEQPTGHLLNFDYFVWVCFIIDFVLNFFSQKSVKGKMIYSNKDIFIHYSRNWMILDLASLLPLHFADHPNAEFWLRLLRVFKMPKLILMVPVKHLIRSFIGCLRVTNNRSSKKLVIILTFVVGLIYQILAMLFTSYAFACIWLFYLKIVELHKNEKPNFTDDYGLDDLTSGKKLVKTWYFIYTTLMTVGYGDLSARNKYEMGLCIVLLIIGPSMYAYSMGKTINIINQLEKAGNDDERVSNSEVWVSSIEAHYGKLKSKLKKKILKHFRYYFKYDRALIFAEKHWKSKEKNSCMTFHNPFLGSIPENLRFKILDYLFKDIFYKFRLFFGDDDNFRFYLCLHIQPRIYRKNTCLIKENTIPTEVMLMEKGKVQVGLMKNREFNVAYEYKSKSVIGDYFVLFNEPSFVRYVIAKKTTGFALPGIVINKVVKAFPNRFKVVKKYAEKRYSNIKRAVEDKVISTDDSIEDTIEDIQGNGFNSYPRVERVEKNFSDRQTTNGQEFNEDTNALQGLSKIVKTSKKQYRKLSSKLDKRLVELNKLTELMKMKNNFT